jgi:amino acid adenylation domain-containing protein
MLEHFETLLKGIVSDAEQHLSQLPLLSGAEQQQLLVQWNDTARVWPEQSCIELFERQARGTPEAVAVVFKQQELSYGELNRRANHLARELLDMGVGAEVLVGILGERSPEFLIAMLAVFKAGGAYVPLDPRHPQRRQRQVIEQSGLSLVLSTSEYAEAAEEAMNAAAGARVGEVKVLASWPMMSESEEEVRGQGGEGLAYVIYTSGSSGQPKGAMVEQSGMRNHLLAKIAELSLTNADTVAATASPCFDISVWQMLAALLVGGRVEIVDDETAHEPKRLLEHLGEGGVTVLEIVPSLLRVMLGELAVSGRGPSELGALRWLVVTGEAFPPALGQQWLQLCPGVPLLNAYGPTECSDDVTHHPIYQIPDAALMNIPIGHPLANTRLYVTDGQLQPMPVGVPGELCVGGLGVGRGYLHDAAATAAVFIPDPFSQEGGARLYRTGDLVRWQPEGVLEFLGRMDQQVKLRGFRIELAEIEAALSSHSGIRECVVEARGHKVGEEQLVAYIAVQEESFLSTGDLRNYLKERLPDYMVPTVFIMLERIPLTANGKIDRAALPEPDLAGVQAGETFVAPRTLIEQKLAEIWAEVLRVERVGIHDNFFELGGHSLLAIMIVSRTREVLQVELPLRRLFEEPTVAGLAVAVSQALGEQTDHDFTTINRVIQDEEQLLTQLGQLSNEQVNLYLTEMLAKNEALT